MTTAQQLIDRSVPFLDAVKNRTAGGELETWLNEHHGPGSPLYDDLARMITDGVRAGRATNIEVDGPKYRRSRISDLQEVLSYFSVTAVCMHSVEPYCGQYHQHPYGELNPVVPLDPGATPMGPRGWSGPGRHHYPEVKGGAPIALFSLPAGRISYDITPPAE